MSKNNKKICTYTLTKGPKVGKKCGLGCRTGNRCKMHNEKRRAAKQSYYENNKGKFQKLSLNEEIQKLLKLQNDGKYIIRKVKTEKVFLEANDVGTTAYKQSSKKIKQWLVKRDKLVEQIKAQKKIVKDLTK